MIIQNFTCYTLFQIPDKGTRSEIRNWNTLIQVLSLRTQPFITKFPIFIEDNLSNYKFGEEYTGIGKIWSFEFEFEHPGLFDDGNDPLAYLKLDTNLVPLVDNHFIKSPRCLIVEGKLKNIYYEVNIPFENK